MKNRNIEKIIKINTKLLQDSKTNKKDDLYLVNDVADLDESASNWDHTYLPRFVTDKNSTSLHAGSEVEKEVEKEVEEEEKAKVVLYGVLGTTSFCQLHSFLSVRADAGIVRYSARHAFPGLAGLAEVHVIIVLFWVFFFTILVCLLSSATYLSLIINNFFAVFF